LENLSGALLKAKKVNHRHQKENPRKWEDKVCEELSRGLRNSLRLARACWLLGRPAGRGTRLRPDVLPLLAERVLAS
jgi:hypothetical protein